jgi:hypothetical protein
MQGGGITIASNSSKEFTISHSDTSSASNPSNSGINFIQNITVDTYGHIQTIGNEIETKNWVFISSQGQQISLKPVSSFVDQNSVHLYIFDISDLAIGEYHLTDNGLSIIRFIKN